MVQKGSWQISIDVKIKEKALATVREIATRLANPQQVEQIVMAEDNTSAIAQYTNPWFPTSLSHGYPGTGLLFAELDRLYPNEGWDEIAFEHIKLAVDHLSRYGMARIGMFGGITGLAFCVRVASREGTRYRRLLGQLDQAIEQGVMERIRDHPCIERQGTSMSNYDVIEGLSGVGRYLLFNRHNPMVANALHSVVSYMIMLTESIVVENKECPGWYVPVHYQFTEWEKIQHPKGYFNCGLAHGIPGPLAFLALCHLHGLRMSGQVEAIRRIVKWLMQFSYCDSAGICWPYVVDWSEQEQRRLLLPKYTRMAWCYGPPGVARSLWLAGLALHDDEIQNISLKAMEAVFRRPTSEWQDEGRSLCHGTAGLLQITQRFYQDTGLPQFADYVQGLIHRILDSANPHLPFLFKDPEEGKDGQFVWLDKAGLLDGASGIALSLLSAVMPLEPLWDQAFLIS